MAARGRRHAEGGAHMCFMIMFVSYMMNPQKRMAPNMEYSPPGEYPNSIAMKE